MSPIRPRVMLDRIASAPHPGKARHGHHEEDEHGESPVPQAGKHRKQKTTQQSSKLDSRLFHPGDDPPRAGRHVANDEGVRGRVGPAVGEARCKGGEYEKPVRRCECEGGQRDHSQGENVAGGRHRPDPVGDPTEQW